ncbi:mechanosensitive ion channel family protein [Labilibacter marinus]|uniref:mechanosensitive ion channel family protein n=1 Tax=Labilibacter marinus TaxID=1477105 RepID=UPI0008370DC6|nr:mechanosensitive ion channel domain-containing protein [Labilibacter marinus]
MKQFKHMNRKTLFFLFFYIIVTLTSNSILYSQEKEVAKKRSIPLSEIASHSTQELKQMRSWMEQDIQKAVNSSIRPKVDTLHAHTLSLKKLTDQIIESRTNFSIYQSLTLRWESIKSNAQLIHKDITGYSSTLENIDTKLKQNNNTWDYSISVIDPGLLTLEAENRVKYVKAIIDSTRNIIADSLVNTIILQNKLSDIALLTQRYIENISENEKKKTGELLLSQDAALWNVSYNTDSIALAQNNSTLLNMGLEDSNIYIDNAWPIMLVLLIIFLGIWILLNKIKSSNTRDIRLFHSNRLNPQIILKRKISTAYILTMLLALWWLPERPILLKEIYIILFLVSFIDLYIIATFKKIRFLLIYLYTLYILSVLHEYLHLGNVFGRFSDLMESFALFSFHIYFYLMKRKLKGSSVKKQFFFRLLNTVQPVYFLITLSAFIANIIGFNYYARMVNNAVLFSLILLLVFATGFFALLSFIQILMGTKNANNSFIIRAKKEPILKWLFKVIRVATVLLWAYYSLVFFLLWEPFLEGFQSIMNIGFTSESWSITLGNVLHFIIVIYVSWFCSNAIRALLELELFGRVKVPRGVPLAVSSLTQYFIIILGCMIGLSVVGFNLQNLSLLAGALGVGIGFGLQNIVNNFISGLILAFERPVTAGDIVIVAGNEGIVQKIGIRASIIKQWDGSEIIVPNADLISKQVTNWSLETYKKRITLTIATPMDTDIDTVMTILKDSANKIDDVLTEPECMSYYKGIKDNKMVFSVNYWLSKNILDSKSLVNIEVQKALSEAGIEQLTPIRVSIEEQKEQKI